MMFDDDVPQHPEEEGMYTPEQVIRKDFEVLWESILSATRSEAPIDWLYVADMIISARLRLYERAGLLSAAE